MSRANLGIAVGFLATLLLAGIGLFLAYGFLGTDAAFQVDSYKPSGSWTTATLAVSFVAAACGAVVTGLVAPGTKAPFQLADVVFVFGLVLAAPLLIASAAEAAPRSGDLSFVGALMQTQHPAWLAIINPLVAKVGVYLGAWPMVRIS